MEGLWKVEFKHCWNSIVEVHSHFLCTCSHHLRAAMYQLSPPPLALNSCFSDLSDFLKYFNLSVANLGGAHPARGPPTAQNFLDFMQFFGKFDKIVCWHPPEGRRLLLQGILDPPLSLIHLGKTPITPKRRYCRNVRLDINGRSFDSFL